MKTEIFADFDAFLSRPETLPSDSDQTGGTVCDACPHVISEHAEALHGPGFCLAPDCGCTGPTAEFYVCGGSGITPEAQEELDEFTVHLRTHPKTAAVPDCRFCGERFPNQFTEAPAHVS